MRPSRGVARRRSRACGCTGRGRRRWRTRGRVPCASRPTGTGAWRGCTSSGPPREHRRGTGPSPPNGAASVARRTSDRTDPARPVTSSKTDPPILTPCGGGGRVRYQNGEGRTRRGSRPARARTKGAGARQGWQRRVAARKREVPERPGRLGAEDEEDGREHRQAPASHRVRLRERALGGVARGLEEGAGDRGSEGQWNEAGESDAEHPAVVFTSGGEERASANGLFRAGDEESRAGEEGTHEQRGDDGGGETGGHRPARLRVSELAQDVDRGVRIERGDEILRPRRVVEEVRKEPAQGHPAQDYRDARVDH